MLGAGESLDFSLYASVLSEFATMNVQLFSIKGFVLQFKVIFI